MQNTQRVEKYIENIEVKASNDVITLDDVIVHHRSNNKKRDYLFVNTLQGKHIPVSPKKIYQLTKCLASKITGLHAGDEVVVIGFAETATALGNLVGEELQNKGIDVEILQTTREDVNGINLVNFEEEHSHATSQKLVVSDKFEDVYLNNILSRKCYIIVEDEITTGNTVINMVSRLKEKLTYPNTRFVVASVCNWQSDSDIQRFKDNGIEAVSLISGQIKDKDIKMIDIDSRLNDAISSVQDYKVELDSVEKNYVDKYCESLNSMLDLKVIGYLERTGHKPYVVHNEVIERIIKLINNTGIRHINTIRLIGTEEFMGYPIKVGKILEDKLGCNVRFHATTRSPIDIINGGNEKGIVNGIRLDRFDQEAKRYLYNIDNKQDIVIVMSDLILDREFKRQLAESFKAQGFDVCKMLFLNIY